MPWSFIKFSQLIHEGNVWRSVWRICMWILGFKDAKKNLFFVKRQVFGHLGVCCVHYFWHQDSGTPCILSPLFMHNSPAFSPEFQVTAKPYTCSSKWTKVKCHTNSHIPSSHTEMIICDAVNIVCLKSIIQLYVSYSWLLITQTLTK